MSKKNRSAVMTDSELAEVELQIARLGEAQKQFLFAASNEDYFDYLDGLFAELEQSEGESRVSMAFKLAANIILCAQREKRRLTVPRSGAV